MNAMNALGVMIEPSQVMTRLREEPSWMRPFATYTAGYIVVTLLMQTPTLAVMMSALPKEGGFNWSSQHLRLIETATTYAVPPRVCASPGSFVVSC